MRLIILIGESESSRNQFEAVGEGEALQCARLYSRLLSFYHRHAAVCFSPKLSLIDNPGIIRDKGANGERVQPATLVPVGISLAIQHKR